MFTVHGSIRSRPVGDLPYCCWLLPLTTLFHDIMCWLCWLVCCGGVDAEFRACTKNKQIQFISKEQLKRMTSLHWFNNFVQVRIIKFDRKWLPGQLFHREGGIPSLLSRSLGWVCLSIKKLEIAFLLYKELFLNTLK